MENNKIRMLIVDDDDAFRQLLYRRFSKPEFQVSASESGEEALRLARSKSFDVGVIDIQLPGISGIELLREIKTIQPHFEAIILTGQATVDNAIESMKVGAYDYLVKPCKLFELEIFIHKAYEKKMLNEQNVKLLDTLRRKEDKRQLIGSSQVMAELRERLNAIAANAEPALFYGEQGSGKEIAAHTTHELSARSAGVFVSINCGVLSEAKLEVELFGHEENAFMGAGPLRRGILENASGGTVMLAETDQIPPSLQVKILHFLETGVFLRVGGFREIAADTRLIFAGREDLAHLMKYDKFREDLFLKISPQMVTIPALRDRREDIPEIVENLLSKSSHTDGRQKRLSKQAMEALTNYNWPANIRELTNVMERAITVSTKKVIQMNALPLSFMQKSKSSRHRHLMSLAEIEKEHILHVLDAVNGNISKASRILGISRPKLYRKMDRYSSSAEA